MAALTHTISNVNNQAENSFLQDALKVLGASVIISLFAHVYIPLPFTPVPITTQVHVVLFLGALLGSKRAFLATFAFLIQGMCGLPVFAGGGGMTSLLGPTGGYLVGYLLAAYVTGFIVERMRNRTAVRLFGAMSVGNVVVYACGALWLSKFVGSASAILLGVVPFLLGDFCKLLVAVKGLRGFLLKK